MICRRLALVGLFVTMLAGGCRRQPGPSNLLLITIDTLRADYLGCYGAPAAATDVLDSLAVAGTVFLATHSPTNRTLPSHASILTARYARSHGVHENTDLLPEGFPTLAEVLSENGWSTAAVISMTFLRFIARGFEDVVEVRAGPRLAERTTAAALRSLDRLNEPFILWVHYYDPHWPYEPPPPYDHLCWEGEPPRLPEGVMAALAQRRLSGTEAAFLESQYRGEIAYTDRCVGQLLEQLRDRGLGESTVVVVTSDHGESMTEHDLFFSHWEGLYQTVIHVPLILGGPGVSAGSRIDEPVSLVDLAPTLLRLVGVSVPHGFRRTDLLDREELSPVIAEETKTGRWALREDERKLIRWREEILVPPGRAVLEEQLGRALAPEESVLLAESPVTLADAQIPWSLGGDLEDVVADMLRVCRARGWTDTVSRREFFFLDKDSEELDDAAFREESAVMRLDSLRQDWLERNPRVLPVPASHISSTERAKLKELGYLY